MEATVIAEIISSVGFPIGIAIIFVVFLFYMVNKTSDLNEKNMEKVQERCRRREEKLYEEIKLNREINAKAIEVIAQYADRLDTIQKDITDIKTDVAIIKSLEGR